MTNENMELESQLKELLLPVLGLESVDEINSDNSLVMDLGAESLDFVEIVYLIEKKFGITLETREILVGATDLKINDLFKDSKLTAEGENTLRERFVSNPERFKAGMTKMNLFSSITVRDLANTIKTKMEVN